MRLDIFTLRQSTQTKKRRIVMKKMRMMAMFLTVSLFVFVCGCGGGGGGESAEATAPVTSTPPATTAPTIKKVTPVGDTNGIDVGTGVSVEFDQPMDVASFNAENYKIVGPSGKIESTLSFGAGNTVAILQPKNPLITGTQYNPILDASSIKGANGKLLLAGASWKFTTAGSIPVNPPPPPTTADSTPPYVISITPANTSTGVATDAAVDITMSEAMKDTGTVTFKTIGGTDVPFGATLKTPTVISVKATSALALTTGYVGTLGGAHDLAGNTMPVTVDFRFTTTNWGSAVTFAPSAFSLYTNPNQPGLASWVSSTNTLTVMAKPVNTYDVQLKAASFAAENGKSYKLTYGCTGGGKLKLLLKQHLATSQHLSVAPSQTITCDGTIQSPIFQATMTEPTTRVEFEPDASQAAPVTYIFMPLVNGAMVQVDQL